MESKDIIKNNTRKEMNNIADNLGIDNPESFSNKSALAEELIRVLNDDSTSDHISSYINNIKTTLKKARDSEFDIHAFKENFKELINSKKEGDTLKVLGMIEDVNKQGEDIIVLDEAVKSTKDLIEEIVNKETRNGFEERLKERLEVCSQGEYVQPKVDCESLKKEIITFIEEQNDYEKTLMENLEIAKERLSLLRETKMEIDHVKELVHQAFDAHKAGDLKKSFKNIEEALECSEDILAIYEKIEEGKKRIQEIKESGKEIDTYLEALKQGKKKANEKEYNHAMQILDDALIEMVRDQEEVLKREENKIDQTTLKINNIYKKIVAIEKALQNVRRDLDDINK